MIIFQFLDLFNQIEIETKLFRDSSIIQPNLNQQNKSEIRFNQKLSEVPKSGQSFLHRHTKSSSKPNINNEDSLKFGQIKFFMPNFAQKLANPEVHNIELCNELREFYSF